MLRPSSTRLLVCGAALFALAVPACRGGEVAPSAPPTRSPHVDKPEVKVALLAATSGGSSLSAIHAMQGARLAFDQANDVGGLPVDVLAESRDTKEDPAATQDALDEIVADPSYVAVIGWPSAPEAGEMAGTLAQAGIAYIDLSPAGGLDGGSGSAQVRMVATDAAQAAVDAEYISRTLKAKSACVAGSGTAREVPLAEEATKRLKADDVKATTLETVPVEQEDYTQLVAGLKDAGCEAVFWTGGGTEAGIIRTEMVAAGIGDVTLVGTDPVRTEAFLDTAGSDGEGTIASCPCTDVTTSTDLTVQRFVQDYQSRNGTPPAPFAAEGYDAGTHILNAISAGNTDRSSIDAYVAERQPFDGLTESYQFDDTGERSGGTVEVSEDRHGTWVVVKRLVASHGASVSTGSGEK